MEAQALGWTDEDQLRFAADRDLVLVTSDEGDFERIAAVWGRSGSSHAGILVVRQARGGPGEQIRRLTRVAGEVDAAAMQNRIEYLSRWSASTGPE